MKSRVLSSTNKNGLLEVRLENSIFYPGGGGQPCDIGFLESEDFLGEVLSVKKEEDDNVHIVKPIKGKIGKEVEMKVNEERRKRLTQMHTGEHILFKSLQKFKIETKLVKIDLDEYESSLFIEVKDLSFDDILKAEQIANEIIEEKRSIKEFEIKKQEAEKITDLRIKKERIKDDFVRVVEIEGFDKSACAGTHFNSTKEVGHIIITNFKGYGPGKFKIRFRTGNIKDLLNISRYAREAANILETNIENLPKLISNIKKKLEEYKEKARKNIKETKAEAEEINGLMFMHQLFEDADQKQLIENGNLILEKSDIVVFVNKKEGLNSVLIFTKKLNASSILNKLLEKFPGKGGGRESFANGGFRANPTDLIDFTKEMIKKIQIGGKR